MKRRSSSTTGGSTTTASPDQRVVVPTNATKNGVSLQLSMNNHQDSNHRSKKYAFAPPFLPCHMRMLKSLYNKQEEDTVSCKKPNCDDTAASSSSPTQKDKCQYDDDETEIWSLIHSFLQQRGHIRRTNSESDKMRGVLAEASSYTLDQTRNDPNNSHHSEHQTVYDERHSKGVGNPNSHRKKQKHSHLSSQHSTTTMLSSFTQQQSPLRSSSSYGANMMGGGFTQSSSSSGRMNHYQDRNRFQPTTTEIFADGFDSWSVLTKILGRKSAASAQKAKFAARPLLPLMKAVNQRLNGLRITLRDMKHARAHRNHSIRILGAGVNMTHHNTSSSGQDNATTVLPENVEGYEEDEEEEEEAIAITSNKIHLWGRLANDLKATIGI